VRAADAGRWMASLFYCGMKINRSYIASFIILIAAVSLAHGQSRSDQKKEKLTGTVIAEYTFMPCFYHPCALWLIVRLKAHTDAAPKFVRVTVEYFPDEDVTKLVEAARRWQFKAVRIGDASVDRYLRTVDSQTGRDTSDEMRLPAWKPIPGADKETIPIGVTLPSYFVRAGKYKHVD
jgi:hypothetical protein